MGEVKHECEHGQLARVCNICAYESDISDLTAERDTLAAELKQADADYQDAITLAQMNKDRLDAALAEVSKLSAAAAQMREALRLAKGGLRHTDTAQLDRIDAALSADAGRNWIDARGAIETRAKEVPTAWRGETSLQHISIPRDWAGRTVLVMVKP